MTDLKSGRPQLKGEASFGSLSGDMGGVAPRLLKWRESESERERVRS